MTEHDHQQEVLKAREEVEQHSRDLRCLTMRRDRYKAKLVYVLHCLDDYTADPVDAGIHDNPDLRDYPSDEDIARLFEDLRRTGTALRHARDRMTR